MHDNKRHEHIELPFSWRSAKLISEEIHVKTHLGWTLPLREPQRCFWIQELAPDTWTKAQEEETNREEQTGRTILKN